MVQHIRNDVDPGVRKTTLVNFFIYGISSCCTSVNWDAISSEAYFRQLIDFGCLFIWYFHYMPVGNDASPSRQPPRPRKSKKNANKKAPPPGRETVLLHARRCYDPLPDACAGAVTSVRVTPLENVRLLRMAEKSLDMLR